MASDEAGMILSRVSERAFHPPASSVRPLLSVSVLSLTTPSSMYVCVFVCHRAKGRKKREVAEPGKPAASVMTAHGASS